MAVIRRDTDYAVRALARLASKREVMSVGTLSEAEQVPADFLRKIIQKLHGADIVESVQGPFGGYRLRRVPEDITLLAIINAVQGAVQLNSCFQEPGICENVKVCELRRRLKNLQKELDQGFAGISLAELAGKIYVRPVDS